MKHTSEPWGYEIDPDMPSLYRLTWALPTTIGVFANEVSGPGTRDAKDNARRACAAVNACAGIPTAALEAGVVEALITALRSCRDYETDTRPRTWDSTSDCLDTIREIATAALARLSPPETAP